MAEKNIHGGHRARLKERFLRDGISGFEKHNILELLLFYAIPQKDTNPLAHALINRFGSLGGVFAASVEELCSVDGVSTHTAALIKLIPELWGEVAGEVDPVKAYNSINEIGSLMVKRYAGIRVETVFLVLLDSSRHIIDIVKLAEGAVNQVCLDTRRLAENAIRKNAAMALLTHNHPSGALLASSDDINTTMEVARVFRSIGVDFLEHLLIVGNKFEPLLSKTESVFWKREDKDKFFK